MKDEGGRMKGKLLYLECFYFILHPSSFILAFPLDHRHQPSIKACA
jgi:hypothetical protein